MMIRFATALASVLCAAGLLSVQPAWGLAVGIGGDPLGRDITYSFLTARTTANSDVNNPARELLPLSDFMPAGYQGEIEQALAAWSAVADITFTEVPDSNAFFNSFEAVAPNTGEIRFAGHAFDPGSSSLAHGFPNVPQNNGTAAADVHFSASRAWAVNPGPGEFSIFLVAAHEIGHALGLPHSASGTLMSGTYNGGLSGPQAADIAAIQALYGVSPVNHPRVNPMVANIASVPLPPALVLLAGALAGLGVFGRRGARIPATV